MCNKSESSESIGDKDFDALLKKWLHHDRLLNDRERYYVAFQAGVLGILSYLFASKGIILLPASLILLIVTWVIFVYYKISQEVDYFYRNAFDKEMSGYVREKIIKNNVPLDAKDCEWATRYRVIIQNGRIDTTGSSFFKSLMQKVFSFFNILFDNLELKIEKYIWGTCLDFRNEDGYRPLMEHRINLMRGVAIVESFLAIFVFIRWFIT